MPADVYLPKRFTAHGLYPFVRQVVGQDGEPTAERVVFDFQRLTFINGYGLTVLCNALEWLKAEGVSLAFRNFRSTQKECIRYLDDCGLFQKYIGESLREECCIRSTTLPFTHVAHAEAFGWLEHQFTPWASRALVVPSYALQSVRACIKELFNNILDHSTRESGYIHCQHYPNMSQLSVTVSDFGKGIPDTIRATFGSMTDEEAILHASRRGVTTKGHPNNQGEGLDLLITNVTGNHGNVSIYSFEGSLACFRGIDGSAKRRSSTGSGSYPGTIVDITLDTNLFVGDADAREEVEW